MRLPLILTALSLLAAPSQAQEVVKVPAKEAPDVARPDDLFALPPGQWQLATPCDDKQCEAGFTSGDLVVSVERSEKFVRIIAGLKNCEAVGFSEIETGNKPGKGTRKKVAKQVSNVVKGVAKSCNVTVADVAPFDVSPMFPPKAETP
jgi:hypothetical protein